MISVWHEREQAIGICVVVCELDYESVRFEALGVSLTCNGCWKDAKKDVILHEVVLRSSITRVAVDQNAKISVCIIRMRLNQRVRLIAAIFFLQLQQNIFLAF